jgi:ribosomal protein L20A (L18A)
MEDELFHMARAAAALRGVELTRTEFDVERTKPIELPTILKVKATTRRIRKDRAYQLLGGRIRIRRLDVRTRQGVKFVRQDLETARETEIKFFPGGTAPPPVTTINISYAQ